MRERVVDGLQRLWLVTRFGCCVQVFHDYVAEATVCVGPSMLPSFNNGGGDIVLCEHLTTRWGEVKRGEVVVSNSPTNPRQTVCKRVLGLGGDVIRVPHVDHFGNIVEREETVPPHHVWLQGDNTRNSNDSRHYGPVPLAMLRGRVCFRMWPLHAAGPIHGEPERCHVVSAGGAPQTPQRTARALNLEGGGSLAPSQGGSWAWPGGGGDAAPPDGTRA